MPKAIGLWIDHRETVLVVLTDNVKETRRITSDLEKHIRVAGGPKMATAEDMRDRRVMNHLNNYYDAVIAQIRDADAIFIFGPGEAKIEFTTRLEHDGLGARIVGLETADKLTEHQIIAKVQAQFSAKPHPLSPHL